MKYWSDEEITFLKFSYPNKDFSVKEIANALDRTPVQVTQKAFKLKLKRPQVIFPEGYAMCSTCRTILPLTTEFFHRQSTKKSGFHCMCKKCKKRNNRELKFNEVEITKTKKCKICNIEKPITRFAKNKNNKDGYLNQCKDCRYELDKKSYIKGGY